MSLSVDRIKQWRTNPISFVKECFNVTPDKWQEDVLLAFGRQDQPKMRIAMAACVGPGKGWHAASRFLVKDQGFTELSNLKVGDVVYAPDGRETNVVALVSHGVRKQYRVTLTDGSFLDVDENHIWEVETANRSNKDRKTYLMETKQILYKGVKEKCGSWHRRKWRLPKNRPIILRKDDNPNLSLDPFLLGAWLGDGSNAEISKVYRELFEYTGLEYKDILDNDNGVFRGGRFKGLAAKLRELGVLNCRSGTKYIPKYIPEEYLFNASLSQRVELLKGLMSTDGMVADDGNCEYNTTSQQLAEDIETLVRTLGGVCRRRKDKSPTYPHHGVIKQVKRCYRINITVPFNPFVVDHKAARWRLAEERYFTRYIDSIEPLPDGETICIEVDREDGMVLTGRGFVPSHNSAVLSWCGWNFLSCYGEPGHHPKGAAVSVTHTNLMDNLWPEFLKWQQVNAATNLPFLSEHFTWTKERIFAKDHPGTWFLSARSYSKTANADEQGRTLSGLHSKYVMALIDESGEIPPPVGRAAEQALAETGCKFGRVLQAGNPTATDGFLYEAVVIKRNLWFVVRITGDPLDPKRSPRIDMDWAQEQIDQYGRDNPWVKSAILGEFPDTAINSLLSPTQVEAAMKLGYRLEVYNFAEKRLGVDVAFQGDDRTVLFPRQGIMAFKPVIMRTQEPADISARILVAKKNWNQDITFVDDTGGWGKGVISHLNMAGHTPIAVQFAGRPTDPRYFNKRAEMWVEMAEWVKNGGALPNVPELIRELSVPTYSMRSGKFLIEPKEMVKKRLKFSPDLGDALALSFAIPDKIVKSSEDSIYSNLERHTNQKEYDPFRDL